MGYKRYKMLQKYVNGVATEEYKQGDLISESEYSTYDVCMEGNEKPDVPVIGTIYQWVNDGTTCDGRSKYILEKQQKSTDNGVTWTNTGATRKGNLIASCSDDCGAEITAKYISNCSYDITANSLTKQWGSSICVNLDITLRNATGVKTFITTIRNKDKTGSTVDWIKYETINTQGGNIWCFDLNEITEDKKCEILWRIDDKYTMVQDLKVKTNQRDYSSEYMTFEAVEDGAYLKFDDSNLYVHAYFKINDGEWNYKTGGKIATNLKSGDKIFVKSDITSLEDTATATGKHRIFNIYGLVVYGNIMSLVYGDDFIGKTTISRYGLYGLFADSGLISAENLILPATTLAIWCYTNMFKGCTSLTSAPQLPATTLANSCYHGMFSGCTSLTQAPELPATTLAESCYIFMFWDCTSLTQAPELPATTLAEQCYSGMFKGCTSLTQTPVLPVTTLAEYCYIGMFRDCTSLTSAPQLPATTLAAHCYDNMFEGCTSLTSAPQLPATTLARGCYEGMFYNCTSLTTAPQLPATTLAERCYMYMFQGCTSLTTAPELPATTLAEYCYYYMFEGCTKLNYLKCLAVTSLSGFCNSWLNGIETEGTFVKVHGVGYNRNDIPSTWTVIEI